MNNISNKKDKNHSKKLNNLVLTIFIISLTIMLIVNTVYFSSVTEFTLDNFLSLLPFNLLGLSLTLYCVMIVLYNLLKLLTKNK